MIFGEGVWSKVFSLIKVGRLMWGWVGMIFGEGV